MRQAQFAIVAMSASPVDFLKTGPVERIRFEAMRRGAARLKKVRAVKRAVAGVIDHNTLFLLTLLSKVGQSIGGRVTNAVAKVEAGYGRLRGRVTQVAKVAAMYGAMYSLLMRPMSRKCVVGWTRVETSVPAVEPEPTPEPVVALVHSVVMPSAARVTQEDEGDNEKATIVHKAKKLLKEGHSQRETARQLEVPISSLRRWLGK